MQCPLCRLTWLSLIVVCVFPQRPVHGGDIPGKPDSRATVVEIIPNSVFVSNPVVEPDLNLEPTASESTRDARTASAKAKSRKQARKKKSKPKRRSKSSKKKSNARKKGKPSAQKKGKSRSDEQTLPVIVPQAVRSPSYMQIRRSIPFLRSEYEANPSYRHEATMELLLGQLRPVVRYSVPREPAAGVALPFGFPRDRMYLPFIIPEFRRSPVAR